MHGALEEWGCICQSEVHDSRNIDSFRGLKGRLVLVFLLDADIVVSPSDIEFREQAFAMQSLQGRLDVRQRIVVSDCVLI